MAGKWRVNVDINVETLMLKFHHNPTDQEVIDETVKYIANVEKALIEKQENAIIEERVDMYRETLKKEAEAKK